MQLSEIHAEKHAQIEAGAGVRHPRVELPEALRTWGQAADRLLVLAEEQLDAIGSPDDHRSLGEILAEKEGAYRDLEKCSERAQAIEGTLENDPATGRGGDGDEIDGLRDGLHETLVALDRVEARCREALRDRMRSVRSGLERLRRSRTVIRTYGNSGGHGAAAPRCLDQRR